MHGDKRLKNILFDPKSKSFILNDFEYASKRNDIIDLDLKAHNGVIVKGQRYNEIHDVI